MGGLTILKYQFRFQKLCINQAVFVSIYFEHVDCKTSQPVCVLIGLAGVSYVL